MSWFGKVGEFIAPYPEGNSVAVKVLLDRIARATTTDERKKCVKLLKAHAANRENHEEIGKGLSTLINILRIDKEVELLCDTLDLLRRIMTCSKGDEDPDNYMQLYNTEVFVQDVDNITTLLDLLEEKTGYVRLHSAELLTTLLKNKEGQMQEIILRSHMGIPRITDLLVDGRDSVRNEGLLVLTGLAHGNQDIQKIIAFEGAFESLFGIVENEGGAEGGIIVQDCINLINILIHGNVSNQNFFRETSCIQRLPAMLELEQSDYWLLTDNKSKVLLLVLETICHLVSENNPNTFDNQTVISKSKILDLVMNLALNRLNSPTVRSKALKTLGDILKGHQANRNIFATQFIFLVGESRQPQVAALDRLLVIALNSQDVPEKLGALWVFKCYLFQNEEAQMAIATTLTPLPTTSEQDNDDSAEDAAIGRRLIHSLLDQIPGGRGNDPFRAWFAACMLSNILVDNTQCKELVLRIPLEIPKADGPLITLLTKTMVTLMENLNAKNGNVLLSVGLLRLLCLWLHECPTAVKAFMASAQNIPFLVEIVTSPKSTDVHVQALSALVIGFCFQFNDNELDSSSSSSSRAALLNIIKNRITLEKYERVYQAVRKTQAFHFAEQDKPVVITQADKEDENFHEKLVNMLLYDYDFTVFFKDSYEKTMRVIRSPYQQPKKEPSGPLGSRTPPAQSDQYLETVLQSYKELIKNQDLQMEALRAQVLELQAKANQGGSPLGFGEREQLEIQLREKDNEIRALKEKIFHLSQASLMAPIQPAQAQEPQRSVEDWQALTQACSELEEELGRKDVQMEQLQRELTEARQEIQYLKLNQGNAVPSFPPQPVPVVAGGDGVETQKLTAELQVAKGMLQSVEVEKKELAEKNRGQLSEIEQLKKKLAESEARAAKLEEENKMLYAAAEAAPKEAVGDDTEYLELRIEQLEGTIKKLEGELEESKGKYESLEEEQEELFVCLAKTELENNNLKERLAHLEGGAKAT